MFSARRVSGFIRGAVTRTHDPTPTAPDRGPVARGYLSLIAAWTLAATSGGIVVIPCAVLACSAPLAIISATSLPSMTKLQPGITSPHLRTLAMTDLLVNVALPMMGPAKGPGADIIPPPARRV